MGGQVRPFLLKLNEARLNEAREWVVCVSGVTCLLNFMCNN